MYCSHCGEPLPEGANFCPSCGTPVPAADPTDAGPGADPETTTAAIDIGAFDAQADVGAVPDLPAGTGMLVVVRGPNAGSRFLLDRDVTTIGRHPDSHIFLDDVTVSRRHAEITRSGGRLEVKDLGSLNGTYVNGERVEERMLASSDEVQVGRFKLMYVGAEST
jgi:pSer/pThr/pTyr-binding forkhead associated (FHA) protein